MFTDFNRSRGLDLFIAKLYTFVDFFSSLSMFWSKFFENELIMTTFTQRFIVWGQSIAREKVSKLWQEKPMIRNSPKTLTWLIKLAFFTLFPASIKTVYRVQNCIPKMVIHRLLWASNSKSTFITKFEYWREFSDSITSRVHTAGLMGKDYLILMTIEYKSCWHALLRTYHCSLVKRFFFFFSAHHYKDNFRA